MPAEGVHLPGLEEDAPAGHVAHSKVKFSPHNQGHLFHFNFEKQHFQVTLGKACNSQHHAERIARLCYLRFEAGDSKDEVVKYRDAVLKDLKVKWTQGLVKEDVKSDADALKKRPADTDASSSSKKPRAKEPRAREYKGEIGKSWASQLGSKASKFKTGYNHSDFFDGI
mmetsp:Transcript_89562/g.159004  ORF Transcript_89562/g.159004 Transcript_89562/m.159004 type:complete len:169 (-) Transcript_89562:181-687(-)|eukprot:CAMPEP_0197661466 /NCGR_PEP_ID=MMETSP1338-20131121/51474_1 /TAXON_ID=43686 ORGANISM="Pelagodinium beii, Strain RCC1491" /NCGR_SAMPLE_ID=MMETSP1338 /ASSEMBLY_ACC=CAM_ASM_000754 /LENGTH=168 /DNA_ID=CAMNT_0043239025 /DNA_START=20 /DNA_END=526 /DNA_ORIENTATION=+